MKTIPQRTLRNDSSSVLREVEAGEQLVITVNGRPVAVLGPGERQQWVPGESFRQILATPTDRTVFDDLRSVEPERIDDASVGAMRGLLEASVVIAPVVGGDFEPFADMIEIRVVHA